MTLRVAAILAGMMLAGAGHALAETPRAAKSDSDGGAIVLTGDLKTDLFGVREINAGPRVEETSANALPSHKSPWLAAGLSLAIPGAGELYAGSYWKSAAFLAVEVAAWVFAYSYDKQGDRQTDSFQDFAQAHWDVARYAHWTIDNAAVINATVRTSDYAVFDANGKVNWSELNRMESALGNWYSHNLPPFGEQQYYELIGKYPQFNQGWDDANLSLPGSYDVVRANLTPKFLYYAGERGKANDYYRHASTFVTVAIVNHVLSAIDAAWTASRANHVEARLGMQAVPDGDRLTQVPVMTVHYTF